MNARPAPVSGSNIPVSPAAELIQKFFQDSLRSLHRALESPEVSRQLEQAAGVIVAAYKRGGALFVAGNGGSAADAQHLVAELVSKLCRDRSPIRAFALTVDTSILTAIGNDYGYDESFARQVSGLARPNDVFLAITTSGNSKNVLRALEECRRLGITSVLLSGETGGKAAALADHVILMPSTDTRLIQESHAVIYHTLCQLIETDLVEAGLCKYC